MRLSDVTKGLSGTLVADGEFDCISYATEYRTKNFLTFLEKEKFLNALVNPNISCVLTKAALADKIPPHIKGVFICESPKAALFQIHNALAEDEAYVGKSFPTEIGKDCEISPLAVIDPVNVKIGDRVVVEPFVIIRGRVTIGDDTIIRAGTIIGMKGFNFSKDAEGNNCSVRDTAKIEIGKNVELFEYASVGAGIFPWEKTVIGDGTKMDSFTNVGHGAHVGENCIITGRGICAANTQVGDNVWIGLGAIVSPRVKVGDNARVSLGSIVVSDVPDGQTVTGNFAVPHDTFMANYRGQLRTAAAQRRKAAEKDTKKV